MNRISRFSRKAIWTTVAAIVLSTATVVCAQGVRWTIVNWKVRHDFPEIRRIDPKQLADWLNDKGRAQPALLDIRTKPEFEVTSMPRAALSQTRARVRSTCRRTSQS